MNEQDKQNIIELNNKLTKQNDILNDIKYNTTVIGIILLFLLAFNIYAYNKYTTKLDNIIYNTKQYKYPQTDKNGNTIYNGQDTSNNNFETYYENDHK